MSFRFVVNPRFAPGGALLAALLVSTGAGAELQVRCVEGCLDAGGNRTMHLLLRPDAATPVTLEWSAPSDPNTLGRVVTLHAGNPHTQGDLRKRRPLRFRKVGALFVERETFSGAELGSGTFITVVTARPGREREEADLSNEEIVDWRPFRLLTMEEKKGKESPPPPATRFAIDLVPALLQAQSGHGPLPRADGGDRRAWWSTTGTDGVFNDLDLDGATTGVPGLGIQVSAPWKTRGDTPTLKDRLLALGSEVRGHKVRFEDLTWFEVPTRIEKTRLREVRIEHFYSVVTLFTRASLARFQSNDLISPRFLPFMDEPHWAHETSARILRSEDPRLWASYSKREYGQDLRYLRLLSERGRIPGIPDVQKTDGDGGSTTYAVGLYARVAPWDEPPEGLGPDRWRAGLVSVDVVAARRGVVDLEARGASGALAKAVWCAVVDCEDVNGDVNLRRPPPGYAVTDAFAALNTLPGNVPLRAWDPDVVERGLEGEDAPADPLTGFPAEGRLGLSATFRAGALIQEASFGRVENLTPIDVYAQYVVRLTVAVPTGVGLVATDGPIIPSKDDLDPGTVTPNNDPWRWFKDHRLLLSVAATGLVGVGMVALCAVSPGFLLLVQKMIAALGKLVFSVLGAFRRKKDG